jgi:hypothetical protein
MTNRLRKSLVTCDIENDGWKTTGVRRGRGKGSGRPHNAGRPPQLDSAASYWQLEAIILTLSTFNVGVFVDDVDAEAEGDVDGEAVAEADEDDELAPLSSTVPVISTLWPTCGVSFASSPSSLYSVAVVDVADALSAPAVPVALLGLFDASFSTNFVSFVAVAPATPLVPVAVCSALPTQPVIVTLFAAVLELDCEVGDSWARSPMLTPSTNVAHVADQILDFMVPPVVIRSARRECNCGTATGSDVDRLFIRILRVTTIQTVGDSVAV